MKEFDPWSILKYIFPDQAWLIIIVSGVLGWFGLITFWSNAYRRGAVWARNFRDRLRSGPSVRWYVIRFAMAAPCFLIAALGAFPYFLTGNVVSLLFGAGEGVMPPNEFTSIAVACGIGAVVFAGVGFYEGDNSLWFKISAVPNLVSAAFALFLFVLIAMGGWAPTGVVVAILILAFGPMVGTLIGGRLVSMGVRIMRDE